MKRYCFLTMAALLLSGLGCETNNTTFDVAVIPLPANMTPRSGAFTFDATTTVFLDSENASQNRRIDQFLEELRDGTGLPLPLVLERPGEIAHNALLLSVEPEPAGSAEAYRLTVSDRNIRIKAAGEAGLFYGLQTLRQLMPPQVEHSMSRPSDAAWSVHALEIDDAPRFGYRGLHLDVGRHFFPVEFIKRYIDLMARYKLNRFHWHLTEDQGWRIEIKKYPKLTEIGSRRQETILEKNFNPYVGDGIPHGGFYTQDEVRDVVAYAADRFVTIIPEIEMPGHSTAALAAYPELACSDGPFEVSTIWGVKDDIYCPSEATFTFLTDVLDEVIDLFPGEYIHIGGDEAPKKRWEESALAQQIIKSEGLENEASLQSWFIRRIESYLNDKNRRLIGWDEILEGGLAPNATVMSWRGMEGGIQAAREGHDVVMTPQHYAYFDYYQGDPESEPLAIGGYLPIDTVYAFEPVPPELTREEARHILGAQANVWTEYIKTPDHVEYMTYPRALAMAEVVWTPAEKRDFSHFVRRLETNLLHLEILGVRYRIPDQLRQDEESVAAYLPGLFLAE